MIPNTITPKTPNKTATFTNAFDIVLDLAVEPFTKEVEF